MNKRLDAGMHRRCVRGWVGVLCLLLGLCAPLHAQVATDSTALEVRLPDPAALAAARQDPAFQYSRPPAEAVSPWDVFWQWVQEQYQNVANAPALRPVWDALPYVLFAAAVLYVLFKLLHTDLRGVFDRRPVGALPFQVAVEDLEAIDFEARIADAVAAHRYREAIRYGYLRVLKILAGEGLIRWQPDKTDRTYLHELTLPALQAPFADLTRWFAYVWYGDRPVDADAYQQAHATFEAFETRLREVRPR